MSLTENPADTSAGERSHTANTNLQFEEAVVRTMTEYFDRMFDALTHIKDMYGVSDDVVYASVRRFDPGLKNAWAEFVRDRNQAQQRTARAGQVAVA